MAAHVKEKRLVSMVPATLSALLAVPEKEVQGRVPGSNGPDLVLSAAGQTFAVEVLGASVAGQVANRAASATKAARTIHRRAIPIVAVPFMGAAGKRACERAGVSWIDFSGNARIIAPGIRVIVDGRPNRFPTRGRPASAFAPKSSRVARYLLMRPGEPVIQRNIARATGLSEGFVSRIVARLEEERYIEREQGGALRVKEPRLLLEAWREQYRFSKHTIIQGHVVARSGDALARLVGDELKARSLEHAATGLAAAWQLTRFATFRIATFYLDAEPDSALREQLGFREDPRGANLWLVVPNDAGVFHGAREREGLRCVHPVQAYLDLKEHPERASEAAERLRAELLDSEKHP
jgi:hypothetical protein